MTHPREWHYDEHVLGRLCDLLGMDRNLVIRALNATLGRALLFLEAP